MYIVRPDGIKHGDNYEIPYEVAPEWEITAENFNPDQWVDETLPDQNPFGSKASDAFDYKFNACAAIQKVLDGKLRHNLCLVTYK